MASIKSWVEHGGGLLILGYYAADTHHGSNVSRLTREWGISFAENLLLPPGVSQQDTRRHVFRAEERLGIRIEVASDLDHPILRAFNSTVLLSAASLEIEHASVPIELVIKSPSNSGLWRPEGPMNPDGMRPLIERWVSTGTGSTPVLVAFKYGRGKVAICGTWKIASLDYADNAKLMSNLIQWLRPTEGG